MAKKLKAVRAWLHDGGEVLIICTRTAQPNTTPVVIVPLAEYRAMRAAVRVAEAYLRGGKLNNAIYAYDRLVMAKKAKARTK